MEEKEDSKESILSQWKGRKNKDTASKGIEQAPIDAVIPLSHGQQQLWFLQQLYPDNPFYNYSEIYIFKGTLHREYLEKAVAQLLEDHDILKSIYLTDNGVSIQKVKATLDAAINFYDFSDLASELFYKEIEALALNDATTKFSLTEGPLFKFSLVKCSETEHRFLVTFNHIVTDKWSMKVFRDDLAAHYARLLKGLDLVSLRPMIQYADYAYHQRNTSLKTDQLVYWKNKLNKAVPTVSLPLDYIRPDTPSFRGALHIESYSNELSLAILGLSKKMATTPFVIILSAYIILLHKQDNQKDIAVGSPVANRNYAALENLIGFFNDTLVLRNRIEPNFKYADLVAEVRKTSLEAFANRDIPFDVLVKTLKPERKTNLNPFFQVMFIYHAVPPKPFFADNLEIENTPSEVGVAKFDLTLYVAEENGKLSSTIEYAADLFKDDTIAKFQKELKDIFRVVLENQEIAIADIEIHKEKGGNHLIPLIDSTKEKNFHPISMDAEKGIHSIIAKVAREHPLKTAVTFKDQSLTYAELDRQAEIIAKNLIDKTKGNSQIIGLCVNRSVEMIVGLLAILKAGAAYLPIDPDYPEKRIHFMVEDAEVNYVLTGAEHAALFETTACTPFFMDAFDELSADIRMPECKNEQLAYVIYTSGSSGKPKGVPITHQNIISSTLGRLDFYDVQPSVFLLLSSIAFDSSKAGLFWTLCTGGNLVVTEKRIEQDIFQIGEIIKKHEVSHTLLLPTLYNLILEHIEINDLNTLTTVIVAGESCSAHTVKRHFDKLPNVSLYNEYGPTEATVWCIAHKIEPQDQYASIPIGKAVADAHVYLLNADFKKVQQGEIGQIFIGGPGLSGTYINRPDLTEAAYIENPFSVEKSSKLYRTGDLGRYRNDGCIEFLGRADQQVKIRGYRIEIDEIEKVLLSNNNIAQAVVVVESGLGAAIDEIKKDVSDDDLLQVIQSHLSNDEINILLSTIDVYKR